jgi:type VI secretion system secreted protein VgrG
VSFSDVYPPLIQDEGKVDEKVPGDTGGRTVFGIDEASNPGDPIFALADAAEAAGRPVATDPAVNARAQEYYAEKWTAWGIDSVPDLLQAHVFGAAVNEGIASVVKLLQNALLDQGIQVLVDGQMGPSTIDALKQAIPKWLLASFCWIRAEAYLEISNNHINDRQFLRGWLNREESGL